ncbi:MAG: Trm112 family protein [Oscillochloridaceae bacterium umkhey_bin13]
MKALFRILGVVALVGIAIVIARALRQYREDNTFELAPAASSGTTGNRSISPELLSILADPGDKGPVELLTDGSGKEWLVNRRNGFRYPVEDGIPIMLLEEGEKYKDESLIAG